MGLKPDEITVVQNLLRRMTTDLAPASTDH